jgi:hypothetical protein
MTKQGQWIEENIPEEGGNPQLTNFSRLEDIGIDRNDSPKFRIRAQRKLGEMLAEMEKNKGAQGMGVPFHDESTPKLSELSISHIQSHRWQGIAAIWKDENKQSPPGIK